MKTIISNFRVDRLKYRLKHDFPQLTFHTPHHRNTSTMVFVETLSPGDVHERFQESTSDSGKEETSSSNDEDEVECGNVNPHVSDTDKTRLMYNAALIIKSSLDQCQGLNCPWPPTSDDLTPTVAKAIIPVELYNMVAWITGGSDEPTLKEHVNLTDESELKVVSLCQDILYLASKGKQQTPKALCLGMTMRHLTGSSQVVSMLNKLGHCASWKTVIRHDTSLAQLQLIDGGEKIPPGFAKKKPTVLVWDNIDFTEETPSGHGTTHHTNGIMIQSAITKPECSDTRPRESLPKGASSLKAPVLQAKEPYHQTKRQGPQNLVRDANIVLESAVHKATLAPARATELAFVFMKYSDANACTIPGWTGFHTYLQSDLILEKSAIHYLPVIEASPTEMSTVNTILKRSLTLANQLELGYVVLVFDLAIYAKIQQIRWKDDDLTKKVIVRLGEFHTCMSFLAILGKRFVDAGLRDVLIEAEVIAQGSINGVLNGHHYNRSIRAHKLMYESLQRLRFQAFLDSLPENDSQKILDMLTDLDLSYPSASFTDACKGEVFNTALDMYQKFVHDKSKANPTFALWSSYIEMVQLLLLFVRATRESNWQWHISTIRLMLPWFFAYDRVNYARYLPAYWLEMVSLPFTHPECHREVTARGVWTVQRQSDHGFGSIACDQAIEQTCNRDSKTKSGLIGITRNRGAVYRWILSQHERAAIARQCEEMAGQSASQRKRKDLDQTRIQNDETAVANISSTIESMINPFETPQEELVCISSGVIASAEVKSDLLNAEEKGESALIDFMDQRLLSPTKDFFSPLKNMKLKTFTNQGKAKPKPKTADDLLHNDKKLFARLLVIGQSRKIDLKEILTYSLGMISYPLASADGMLAKTNKSALLQHIEAKCPECLVEQVPENSTIIFDGMAVIQALTNIPPTFGELADTLLMYMIQVAKKMKATRLDFVTDRYFELSIKSMERSQRGVGGSEIIHIYKNDQKTPNQWKKFLSEGRNKEALIQYLFETWQKADFQSLTTDIDLYITHGGDCHAFVIKDGKMVVSEVQELTCDHEESDTRMFLHAQHAMLQSYQTVIIRSPDTDVAVIGISLKSQFPVNMFFFTGVGNKTRIIDLQVVVSCLGYEVSEALIGFHTFTGCDSTSAFYGKGKKKAYAIASGNVEFTQAFTKLGSDFSLDESTTTVLERFVCHLYGQPREKSVNDVRYKIFCHATSSLPERNMPPTHDALQNHCKRANYQAAIMKSSLKQQIDAPTPVGQGWHLDGNKLSITWITRGPAPTSVLQAVHCSCKTSKCVTGRCSCVNARLSCTDLCKCIECTNTSKTIAEQTLEMEDESDESDLES